MQLWSLITMKNNEAGPRYGNLHCIDCDVNTEDIGEYYMVHVGVWPKEIGPHNGMLCIGCLEKRIGRQLTPEDFTLCPLNTFPGSERLESRRGTDHLKFSLLPPQ